MVIKDSQLRLISLSHDNFLTPAIFMSILIPWQRGPCTPFLALGLVARTLPGTSGHTTEPEAWWEDSSAGRSQDSG